MSDGSWIEPVHACCSHASPHASEGTSCDWICKSNFQIMYLNIFVIYIMKNLDNMNCVLKYWWLIVLEPWNLFFYSETHCVGETVKVYLGVLEVWTPLPATAAGKTLYIPLRFRTDYWSLLIFALFYYHMLTLGNWWQCCRVALPWKQTVLLLTANSPRGVDPDDANVAEKNTLLVFLVLARAAFLSPVGRVAKLRQGALLRHGALNREGWGWKYKWKRAVSNFL